MTRCIPCTKYPPTIILGISFSRYDLYIVLESGVTLMPNYNSDHYTAVAQLSPNRVLYSSSHDENLSAPEELMNKEQIMLDAIDNHVLEAMPTSDEDLEIIFSKFN